MYYPLHDNDSNKIHVKRREAHSGVTVRSAAVFVMGDVTVMWRKRTGVTVR